LIVLYHENPFKVFSLLDQKNVFIQPNFPTIKIFERHKEIQGSESIYLIQFTTDEKHLFDKLANLIGRFWNYFSYSGLETISLAHLVCPKCSILACSCTSTALLENPNSFDNDKKLNDRIEELLQHLNE
jgi:hypothetical protein